MLNPVQADNTINRIFIMGKSYEKLGCVGNSISRGIKSVLDIADDSNNVATPLPLLAVICTSSNPG